MNINEQIVAFRNERAQHVKDIQTLLEAAEGATLDTEKGAEHDEHAACIKTIDQHITRLESAQALIATTATTVVPSANTNEPAGVVKAVSGRPGDGVIAVAKRAEKGVGFARFAVTMAQAKGNFEMAHKIAKNKWPEEKPLQDIFKLYADAKVTNDDIGRGDIIHKASMHAGTTTGAEWAAPLVNYQTLVDEFLEYLRPQTLIDRITGLRRVPFNVKVPKQITGGTAFWTGEGKPKPVTELAFRTVSLGYNKIATISVITQELARLSSPSAETTVRDQLAAAIVQQMDADFIDPGNSGTATVKPASITNGATAIAASGGATPTFDNIVTDIKAMFAVWIAANLSRTNAVWIMSESTALSLSLRLNNLGQRYFPDLTPQGGTFFGIPVVVTESSGLHDLSGSERIVVLAKADTILLADDGRVTVDSSTEASIEMLDNPTNTPVTPTATSLISMFQTDSIAIRAERWITWVRGRDEGVVYLTNAQW